LADFSPDAVLTRDAQAGQADALGSLLIRHQADLRAVALSILGPGPDAEDAVQEATLIALRRIGDVRDPGAVGPWLRMIVRNQCRMRLRAKDREEPRIDLDRPATAPSPDQVLEEHALRDWLWHAIEQLSPPLRTTLLLRHFSGVTRYEEIAAACEVPVGTVRSRLSEARAKLTDALLATAEDRHDDAGELSRAASVEAVETLAGGRARRAQRGRGAALGSGFPADQRSHRARRRGRGVARDGQRPRSRRAPALRQRGGQPGPDRVGDGHAQPAGGSAALSARCGLADVAGSGAGRRAAALPPEAGMTQLTSA
jgi:RNA polymerase sigma factor (sigma-70 family)